MHVLPQLRKLEHSFPDQIAVVGVHSPKFPGEQPTEALRQAVLRLGVEHPVVNDRDMRAWSEYAVQAWPTLMLVDPAGNVIGKHEGEFQFDEFRNLVAAMLAEFDSRGVLSRRPIAHETERPPATPLLLPEKVLADGRSGRLFVADSGHDRILVATLDGQVQLAVGSSKRLRDGGPTEAAFDGPHGMAIDRNWLYVADTWNHAIRRIDLSTGEVSTVAGTGELGPRVKEGPGATTPLRSPWDLAFNNGLLYIAMAGSHQIWTFDPRSGEIARYAGSGREALADGPLERATFAQPSGLASSGRMLYVADSEASAVRAVALPGGSGQVMTLVGQGLFDFGDVDGAGATVRLQHPLGVCFDPFPRAAGQGDGMLYLADSYNHRIKRLDPRTRQTATMLGSGAMAHVDGVGTSASFWEPGGLSLTRDRLYVADTNNHAIRVVDLATLEVSTLELRDLP